MYSKEWIHNFTHEREIIIFLLWVCFKITQYLIWECFLSQKNPKTPKFHIVDNIKRNLHN